MDTYLVKVNKQTLQKFPEVDRVLFLSFAHFANELRALEKLLVWSMPKPSLSDPENAGQVALMFMFLKLIAGKLNEANKLVQQKLYGTVCGKELISLLPKKAKEALAKINTHFSSGGTVNKIRNLDAFHYRTAEVQVGLDKVPEEMEVYLQKVSVNTLYYFAEVLAVRAIFVELGFAPDETEKGLKRLQRDVTNVSHWFTVLSDALLAAIVKKHGDTTWEEAAKPVTLGPLPAFDEIRVPWFVDAEKEIRST